MRQAKRRVGGGFVCQGRGVALRCDGMQSGMGLVPRGRWPVHGAPRYQISRSDQERFPEAKDIGDVGRQLVA